VCIYLSSLYSHILSRNTRAQCRRRFIYMFDKITLLEAVQKVMEKDVKRRFFNGDIGFFIYEICAARDDFLYHDSCFAFVISSFFVAFDTLAPSWSGGYSECIYVFLTPRVQRKIENW